MRTTLTLDDDLGTELRARARQLNIPFNQVVNDAIRSGLSPSVDSGTPTAYRVRPFNSGLNPEVDPERLNQLLNDVAIENDAERRKD